MPSCDRAHREVRRVGEDHGSLAKERRESLAIEGRPACRATPGPPPQEGRQATRSRPRGAEHRACPHCWNSSLTTRSAAGGMALDLRCVGEKAEASLRAGEREAPEVQGTGLDHSLLTSLGDQEVLVGSLDPHLALLAPRGPHEAAGHGHPDGLRLAVHVLGSIVLTVLDVDGAPRGRQALLADEQITGLAPGRFAEPRGTDLWRNLVLVREGPGRERQVGPIGQAHDDDASRRLVGDQRCRRHAQEECEDRRAPSRVLTPPTVVAPSP